MKYFTLCALALAVAGASCRATHEPAAVSPHAEARTATTGPGDDAPARPAGVVVQPHQSAVGKLLGWPKPKPAYYSPGTSIVAGKKSTITINHVHGNQSNTSATIGKKGTAATGEGAVATLIEKKAGPAVVNSDSAALNAVGGDGNLAATNGDGNTTSQTKADVEPPGVGATIAKELTGPIGITLAIGLAVGAIYLVVLWRKKKAVTDLV